ncbi:hypothetical protein AB0M02_00480 [Actinoplanes sp. NPDC051861]|uniref:hypothetical protein n=1 Tax=Actinoplanes sp. NPDC051861 TaxID=3155170 RepID=UPI00344A5C2B
MYEPDGLSLVARGWLQDKADRDYGGDLARAADAVLEAACAAELAPDDPWAGLQVQVDSRPVHPGRPGRLAGEARRAAMGNPSQDSAI